MISRPISDNPHAYISQIRLQPEPHPTEISKRFAQPKTAAAAYEGASAAPEQKPGNSAFAQPANSAPASLPPNPPPPPGNRIDVYA